jgi:hypothetical protein
METSKNESHIAPLIPDTHQKKNRMLRLFTMWRLHSNHIIHLFQAIT